MKRRSMFFLMMFVFGLAMVCHGQGQPTGSMVLSESFSDTIYPRPGWIADGVTRITSAYYSAPASANFGSHNGSLTLPDVSHPGLLRFWLGRTTATTPKLMIVEVSADGDPTTFVPVDTFDHDNTDANLFTFCEVDLSLYSHIPAVTIRFRKSSSTTSPWRLDDVEVYATASLPVLLSSFYGEHHPGQGVMLHWSTAMEIQNAGFTVLKGGAAVPFQRVGEVFGSGTNTGTVSYNWLDREPYYPTTYYRLLQTDFDGTTDTLQTITVVTGFGNSWDVEAVHAGLTGLTLTLSEELMGTVTICISDMQGRIVYLFSEEVSGQKLFSLRVKLLAGVYVLIVSDSTHRVTRKFSVDP